MRHKKAKGQLNRFTSWHKATLESLARNVLIRESIITTQKRAKAARPLLEKLISLAQENTLYAKRRAFKILGDHKLVKLLFEDIAPRFTKNTGGYTRALGVGRRRGDNTEMVVFQLTQIKKKEPKKHKKEKESKPEESAQAIGAGPKEEIQEEKKQKPEQEIHRKEKLPITQKPRKKFLGGLKNIFKKERDSL